MTASGGRSQQPATRVSDEVGARVARRRASADLRALSGGLDGADANVGAQLRARRLAHGISLRQFAKQLDVSASFLSQLETGKAQPSVATLFSICSALDISIDDLFAASRQVPPAEPTPAPRTRAKAAQRNGSAESASPVVSPEQRRVLALDSGVTWERLTAHPTGHSEFMFVRYDVGGGSTLDGQLIRHAGTEYGYVLRGTLEITLGFDTYRLGPGDSISFDSSRPHRLTNVGDEPVEAIWFDQGTHPSD